MGYKGERGGDGASFENRVVVGGALPRQALDSSTGSPWACLTSSMILLFCLLVYTAASSDCFVHAPVLQLQPRSFLALAETLPKPNKEAHRHTSRSRLQNERRHAEKTAKQRAVLSKAKYEPRSR